MDTDINALMSVSIQASDLVEAGSDVPFNIPPYFALLARAVTLLEGIALSGCVIPPVASLQQRNMTVQN